MQASSSASRAIRGTAASAARRRRRAPPAPGIGYLSRGRPAARLHRTPHCDGGDPGEAPLLGGASARSRLRGPPGGQLHHPRHRRGLHRPASPLAGAGSCGRRARSAALPSGSRRREGGPCGASRLVQRCGGHSQRALRSRHHRAGLSSRGGVLPELHPEVSGRTGLPPLRAPLHPDRRARRLDAGRTVHGDRRAGARGWVADRHQGVSRRPPQLRRAGDARPLPARGEEPQQDATATPARPSGPIPLHGSMRSWR